MLFRSLLKKERAAAANSIVTTFGGDLLSPSIMSGFHKGAQMIELMNAVGIDVAVPGNHEFDFGPDVFQERVKESKFTWIASNLTRNGRPFDGVADTLLRTYSGVNVGFFGLVTPETAAALTRMLSSTVTTGTSRKAFRDRRGKPRLAVDVAAKTGSIDGTDPKGHYSWFAAFAPAQTPKDIIQKLNTDFVKAIRSPEVRVTLEKQGNSVEGGSPDELARLVRTDFDRWARVIKNIKN